MTYPPGPGPPGPHAGRPGGYPRPHNVGPYGGYGQYGRPGYAPAPYGRGPFPPPGYPPQGRPGFPPQGGPGFGGGPQGPRKNRTALWVSLSVVIAAGLVIFLVTGLLAPGFLLGDNRRATRSGDEIHSPKDLAVALVDSVNSRDRAALRELTCASSPTALRSNIEHIAALSDVELTLVRTISPRKAVARLELTLQGTRMQVRSDLRKERGTWCWQDWEPTNELATI